MNLRHFIYTKKSNTRLLNQIEKTFGKDCHIYYGNWARNTQMKYNAPTPGVGIRRMIAERFKCFLTDEWGSSKYCYHDGKAVENRKLNGKKHHRCLVCVGCASLKNGKQVRFMNRDKMGGLNIHKIGDVYLTSQKRPETLTRGRDQIGKMEDPFDVVLREEPKKLSIKAPVLKKKASRIEASL